MMDDKMISKNKQIEKIDISIRCANLHIKRSKKRVDELMKRKNRIMGKR